MTVGRNRKTKHNYCKFQHKRRFRDKKAALATIQHFASKQALNHLKPNHIIPVRAYFCPHCNGFHLTSQQDIATSKSNTP